MFCSCRAHFARCALAPTNAPPGCPAWGWGRIGPVLKSTRADCGGHLFTAKLGVVVHYLPHQMLNHLLPDDAALLARQFCDCLRDRINDFICFRGIDFV